MSALVIANTQIRRDGAGRYCLNDLHQASGGAARHRPSRWLENQSTQELVAEIEAEFPALVAGIPATRAVFVESDGFAKGTYAVKELVYAYAMWISAAFHLHVIRAYDALVQGQQQAASTPRLPEAPPHRADVMVAATRSFAALVRAGRTLRMSHARAVQAANAATHRATGVDLVQELDAADLVAERRPAGLLPGGESDAWEHEPAVLAWLNNKHEVSTRQVLSEALNLDPDDRAAQTRLGILLARLGWRRFRKRGSGYFYTPPSSDL